MPKINHHLPRLMLNYHQILETELDRKLYVMNITVIVTGMIAGMWGLVDALILGRTTQGVVEISSSLLGLSFLWWQRYFSKNARIWVYSAIVPSLILLASYANIINHELGLGASNTFWLFLGPPSVFFLAGWRKGVLVSAIFTTWILVFFYLTYIGLVGNPVGFEYVLDLLTAFAVVSVFLFLYDWVKEGIQADLIGALHRDRTVLDTISDGIIVIDNRDHVLLINRAAADLLGWSSRDALDHEIGAVFKVIGDIQLKKPQLRNGIKILGKRGQELFVDLKVSPIYLRAHEEIDLDNRGYMLTIHDVTNEKELERMKLDFVAMAAHELRTPLTSLYGYLSVLKEEAMQSLSGEYQEFINRSITSIKRLAALMENLLSITRIERGEVTIHKRPIVWEDLVQERVEEFEVQANQLGLELKWNKPAKPLPKVIADPLRIVEVLNNLLNNAITYTKKGEIVIWCEYDNQHKMVVTHVKDTGPGIPEESLPHMFEKFYRVSGILEEGSKGTGLGLYISKSLVALHQGKIWVESKLGEGSTFSFSLPVVPR